MVNANIQYILVEVMFRKSESGERLDVDRAVDAILVFFLIACNLDN